MDFKIDIDEVDTMKMSLDEIIATAEKKKTHVFIESPVEDKDLTPFRSLDDIINDSKAPRAPTPCAPLIECDTCDDDSLDSSDKELYIAKPLPRFTRGRSLSPVLLQRASDNASKSIAQKLQNHRANNFRKLANGGGNTRRSNFKNYRNFNCSGHNFCLNRCRAQLRLMKVKHDLLQDRGIVNRCDRGCFFGSCGGQLRRYPSCSSLSSISAYSGWSCPNENFCRSGYESDFCGEYSGFQRKRRSRSPFRFHSNNNYSSGNSTQTKKRVLNPEIQRAIREATEELHKQSPMSKTKLSYAAEKCSPIIHTTAQSMDARFRDYYAR